MDTFAAKILTIYPEGKRYGWTPNIQAKLIFEILKDERVLIQLMNKHKEAYIYMLTYFIRKGYVKKFKQYFSLITWNKELEGFLNKFLTYSIRYKCKSVFKVLCSNWKYNFGDLNLLRAITDQCLKTCSKDDLLFNNEMYTDICREYAITHHLADLKFGTLDVVYGIMNYENDVLVKTIISETLTLFDAHKATKQLSVYDTLVLFGYAEK